MARRYWIEGRVQGVGFRPFAARLAQQYELTGWVRNRGGGVEVVVQGGDDQLAAFEGSLRSTAPPRSRIDRLIVSQTDSGSLSGFLILPSVEGEPWGRVIPSDWPVCAECLSEMKDPQDPRFAYPFTHCVACGPRYTILTSFPLDRSRTTMAAFPLCGRCEAEYQNPRDRRFHAQLAACPACGPSLRWVQGARTVEGSDDSIVREVVLELERGGVLLIKGTGGYHLVADATSAPAVAQLRRVKQRPQKPLAVMVPGDPQGPGSGFEVPPPWREALTEGACPIVLMPKVLRPELDSAIAPGLSEVGVMLPHNPFYVRLLSLFGRPLVVTSANDGDEPILIDEGGVTARWSEQVAGQLHHDRVILRPADDSLYRVIGGIPRPLRLGRGSSPRVLRALLRVAEPMLAVGGDFKNTLALAEDEQIVLTPHLGTLGSPRSRDLFFDLIASFTDLTGIHPRRLICDAHPDYRSAVWAESLGLPLTRVYHHHAHASAVYAEANLKGPLMVFAFDGSGYGPDGRNWGGEVLLGVPGAWQHWGGLRTFRLPGGERASREGWRCALAITEALGLDWPGRPKAAGALLELLSQGVPFPVTSSVGRLFDAAAALCGVCLNQSYEGEAAMRLEALADPDAGAVAMPLFRDQSLWRWDWDPLIRVLLDEQLPPTLRAGIFHQSLVEAVWDMAVKVRSETGVSALGLGGGVFQNKRLAEGILSRLGGSGFSVHLPKRIPVNDGGLSVGQIIEAAAANVRE